MISLDLTQRAHHDFETRSACDLKKEGLHRYFQHPSTFPWVMSWRIGSTGPKQHWRPGYPDPVELLNHVYAGGTMVAHNAAFERHAWNDCVRVKIAPHWPELRIEQQDCTLARACVLALPPGLEHVARVMGTTASKDMEGAALMRQMAVPASRAVCQSCMGAGCEVCLWCGETYTWKDAPSLIDRLELYCDEDVETETQVDVKLPFLTERERRVWEMDQRINDRGIMLDRALIHKLLSTVEYTKKQMDSRMAYLTHGRVKACTQVAKIIQWLNECGVKCESVAKGEIFELLVAADQLTDLPECREVVELRSAAAKSSTAKLQTALRCMGISDDRARGLLFYFGTLSSRWAGRLIQPQNLYAVDDEVDGKDLEHTIKIVMQTAEPAQSHSMIEMLIGQPMTAIAKCLKSTFVPAPSKRFVGGDLSNIEGRINAWLAREKWKVDAFRLYDRREGPDLYKVAYNKSFGVVIENIGYVQRQVGKVQELALGYQGAVGAYVKMAKNRGIQLGPLLTAVKSVVDPDMWEIAMDAYAGQPNKYGLGQDMWSAVSLVVKGFRTANSMIVQGWWDLQDGAINAVSYPGVVTPVFGGRVRYLMSRGFLWCQIPSGSVIAYCNPAVRTVDESFYELPDGSHVLLDTLFPEQVREYNQLPGCKLVQRVKKKVTYEGLDSETRRWATFSLYGGMQCAHVVSATARDVLVDAMLECERRDYSIVLTVHDEILTEQDYGKGTKEELLEIMSKQPPWIDDQNLPLNATTWESARY